MYVVDASVWVGRYVPGDRFHRASRSWLAAALASGELLVLPSLALVEVAGALARRTGSDGSARRAAALIAQLPGVRVVPLDPSLTEAAVELAARCRLRGADAVYVGLAAGLGVPLVTWDDEQRRRAGTAIQTFTPLDVAAR